MPDLGPVPADTDRIQELQEMQGWTDYTLLQQALSFIDRQSLTGAFADDLQETADEENTGSDAA